MIEPLRTSVVTHDVLESRELTPKERTMWLFKQFAPEVGVLNVPLAVRLPGELHRGALQAAVDAAVRRHPALRTVFPLTSGEPRRVTLEPSSPRSRVTVEFETLRADQLEDGLVRVGSEPFDVSDAPPIRVRVLSSPGRDVLCVVVDHLVYDAHSAGVLERELLALYRSLRSTGRVPADLATVVDASPPEPAGDEGVEHWRTVLAGARPTPDLEIGRQQSRDAAFPGAVTRHRLGPTSWEAVAEVARRTGSVPSAVLLAAFVTVLARHGAGDDVVLGAPTFNRGSRGHDAIGYFTSIQPLRVRPVRDLPFDVLVRQCTQSLLEGIQHSGVGLDDVAPDAYQANDADSRPLVRYLFNYVVGLHSARGDASDVERLHVPMLHSRMDLDLAVMQDAESTSLRAIYASDLFDAAEVDALLARVEAVLEQVRTDRPTLGEVDLWSHADRALVASLVPDRASHSDEQDLGVLDDVTTTAFASPASPAVAADGVAPLTFGALLSSATALAGSLVAAGARPGATVAITTEDPVETAVAVVAAWSAHCTVRLTVDRAGPHHPSTLTVVGSDATPGPGEVRVVSVRTTGPVLPPLSPHPDDTALEWHGAGGRCTFSHRELREWAARLGDHLDPHAAALATVLAPGGPAGLLLAVCAWTTGGAVHLVPGDPGTVAVRSVLGLDEIGVPVAVHRGAAPTPGDAGAPVTAVAIVDTTGVALPPGVFGTLRLSPGRAGQADVMLDSQFRITFAGTLERRVRNDDAPRPTVLADEAPTAADGSTEEMLELWRRLLRRPDLTPDQNFFAVGGDSMLAARVVGHLKRTSGVRVSLRTLFTHPTAEAFAAEVDRARSTTP
ncbi:condensation domain-containing protein [uncultured Cellulomonas sp.]|uniref:condensation domain-containing protein n=1 Tax=uncultured Cellulomonas sp. TaxID=189682 RepID=UPI0028EA74BC|nr:condensation domain-containing protein [uncultured Cellulomonas sp.]